MTAQEAVGIIQKRLRDRSGSDEGTQILGNSRRVRIIGCLACEGIFFGGLLPVANGVMSTGAIVGLPARADSKQVIENTRR